MKVEKVVAVPRLFCQHDYRCIKERKERYAEDRYKTGLTSRTTRTYICSKCGATKAEVHYS